MKRKGMAALMMIFAILLASKPAGAEVPRPQDMDRIFEESNQAYWKGDYANAAAGYQRLADLEVESADLYHNLGTSYARSGQLGRSVLYLEKAIRLNPGFEEARFNLGEVRAELARRHNTAGRDADLAPRLTPWRAVIERFTPATASIFLLISTTLLWAVLLVRWRMRAEMTRLVLAVAGAVLFLLAVSFAAVLLGTVHLQEIDREGIVVESGAVTVSEGPGQGYKKSFRVLEGERVQVMGLDGKWRKIRDDRGREGWVETSMVGSL